MDTTQRTDQQRSADRRRRELLEAADRVVLRDGPQASMNAIAAAAGITKPILYRHFGDKGGLYAALATRHTDRLLAVLQDALATKGTPRERVARTVEAYLQAIEDEPQVYRFLVHSDEIAQTAAVAGQVQSFLARLSELLATGIATELGMPRGALRAEVWARAIVGMVQRVGDWWIDTGSPQRAQVVAELTDLLWGAYADAAARDARH